MTDAPRDDSVEQPTPAAQADNADNPDNAEGTAAAEAGIELEPDVTGDDLPEVEVVEDPTVVAQRERDDYLDQLLRARAEFDNFRKRNARERMEALDRGAEQLVAKMMGVLDNLGFALDAAEKSEDVQLAKGVQMVHAELMGVLVEAGLAEVPGKGATFDPAVHEAVMQVEAAEADGDQSGEPVVVDVLRRGWMFKERLLRPASVSVAGP